MAMLVFRSEARNDSFRSCAVKVGQKQPRTTASSSGGLQVAMHSLLTPFVVIFIMYLFLKPNKTEILDLHSCTVDAGTSSIHWKAL